MIHAATLGEVLQFATFVYNRYFNTCQLWSHSYMSRLSKHGLCLVNWKRINRNGCFWHMAFFIPFKPWLSVRVFFCEYVWLAVSMTMLLGTKCISLEHCWNGKMSVFLNVEKTGTKKLKQQYEVAAKVALQFVSPAVQFTLQDFFFTSSLHDSFSVHHPFPWVFFFQLPQSLFQYSVPYSERFVNNFRHARRISPQRPHETTNRWNNGTC